MTDNEYFKRIIIDTIYISDALFWLVYLSLFWYLLILFHQGYMKSGNALEIRRNFDPRTHIGKIKIIFCIYIIIQFVLVALYNTINLDKIFDRTTTLIFIDIGINASIPLLLFYSQFYFNIKFSGMVFQSSLYEKKTKKLNNLAVIWAIMRIISILFIIFAISYKDSISDFVNGTLSIFWEIIIVFVGSLNFLFSTILPFQIALSKDSVALFLIDYNQPIDQTQVQPLERNLLEGQKNQDSYDVSISLQKSSDLVFSFDKELFIKFSEIKLCKDGQIKQRVNGLGILIQGNLKNLTENEISQYMFREIHLQQISTYILDEVKREIQFHNQLNTKYLVPIRGYTTTSNSLILVYTNYVNDSLFNLLHNKIDKQNLLKSQSCKKSQYSENDASFEFRLDLVMQIANALDFLHSQQPPIVHGHLTPHNLLFNKKMNLKISDLGLNALKKYCSIVIGYSIKSQYSAPEVLQERQGYSYKPEPERDIYSLGLIIYEIFTETTPFEELSLKQQQKMIEEQQARPKINDSVSDDIKNLIKFCWQQDPKLRPRIKEVLDILRQIKQSIDF